ncbi:MAG: hypothetical protein LBR71_01820, partial [Synergistaceae bacterium]|nr:hypothetical protein [Synergistaceae bacterium]
ERDSEPRTRVARFLRRGEGLFGKLPAILFSFFSRASFFLRASGGADPESGIALLRERCRGIHPRLLRAVFDCADPRKREAFLNWFENDIQREREEDAREVLVSLGMLLEYCGVSMIVCFDQLDGMREEDLVTAFGDVVHFLVNDVRGILPLAFIRLNTWSERFSRLDPAVTQRLSGNEMFLYACTLEQARELVRVRLESRFKNDAEEKFQWLMARLEGKLKAGYSPRVVIELANREIVRSEEESEEEAEPARAHVHVHAHAHAHAHENLAAEYGKALYRAHSEFGKRSPDAESLVRALETYLTSRADFKGVRRSAKKYISLTGCREGGGACAFVVNTEENPRVVWAALKHGTDFLRGGPGRECFYVADGRCDFGARERWPKVYEELEKFKEAKGVALFLNREQAAVWYALAALRLEVDRENVHLSLPGGGKRPAQIEDLLLFLRQEFEKNLLEWGEKEPA